MLLSSVVLRIDDLLNEVFRFAFNEDGWRRWLLSVLESVGVLRFQLRDMEDRVNTNGSWESKCKRHGRRLGHDEERPNLLLC